MQPPSGPNRRSWMKPSPLASKAISVLARVPYSGLRMKAALNQRSRARPMPVSGRALSSARVSSASARHSGLRSSLPLAI